MTGRYQPKRPELLHVAEAIRLMGYVVAGAPCNPGENVKAAEMAALSQAVHDFWCQEAEDVELWKQCARLHNAGPQTGKDATWRRKRAWFEYIRTAAEWQQADQAAA